MLLDGKVVGGLPSIDGGGRADIQEVVVGDTSNFRSAATFVLMKAHKLHYRTVFQGMKISIENRKGSYRSGKDSDGKPWRTKLKFPYGYLVGGPMGADNENLDCFIGPDKASKTVFVIHQKDVKTGKYDEDKVMLGWKTKSQAVKDYLSNYNRKDMYSGVSTMTLDQFKKKAFSKKYRGVMIKATSHLLTGLR